MVLDMRPGLCYKLSAKTKIKHSFSLIFINHTFLTPTGSADPWSLSAKTWTLFSILLQFRYERETHLVLLSDCQSEVVLRWLW